MRKAYYLAAFFVCLFGTTFFAGTTALEAKQGETEFVLRCMFEGERKVSLIATKSQVVWHENGIEYSTKDWTDIRITHDPILTVFAYGPGIGSPRLDIFQGVTHSDKPNYELGTAIISETLVGRDKLLTKTVEGFCEAEKQN